MLAYRKEVPGLENQIAFLDTEASDLHRQDKAFFYQGFILGMLK